MLRVPGLPCGASLCPSPPGPSRVPLLSTGLAWYWHAWAGISQEIFSRGRG